MRKTLLLATARPALVLFLGLCLALLASATGEAGEANHPDPQIARSLAQGEAAFEKGKPVRARKAFEAAVKASNGQDPAALMRLAWIERYIGEFQSATRHAQAAVELAKEESMRSAAYHLLGQIFFKIYQGYAVRWSDQESTAEREKRWEWLTPAEETFRRALEGSGPGARESRLDLAWILLRQKNYDEAHRMLESYDSGERPELAANLRCLLNAHQEGMPTASMTGGMETPKIAKAGSPEYTAAARSANLQGDILIEGIVTAEGKISCLLVEKGLPLGLTESAIRAIRKWRFEPATRNGEPLAVRQYNVVRFSLRR